MILDRILESKRAEIADAKGRASLASLRERPLYAEARRGFAERVRAQGRSIIAEIKKASPSKGQIRADFRPAVHATQYEKAGARCISVLTDGPFFQGCLSDLESVRAVSTIPLLRKDFMLDPYQIVEARASGADCILLIVAALEDSQLAELSSAATEEGLDVLVEVHDEKELERALLSGAALLGVNNRNLQTFETSLDTTRRLAALTPPGITLVSESGLSVPAQLAELEAIGVSAFLIGETFMREEDPGLAVQTMLGN